MECTLGQCTMQCNVENASVNGMWQLSLKQEIFRFTLEQKKSCQSVKSYKNTFAYHLFPSRNFIVLFSAFLTEAYF